MITMRRKRARKMTVVPYRHHPKFKWTLSGYYVDGKRIRRFFETKDVQSLPAQVIAAVVEPRERGTFAAHR